MPFKFNVGTKEGKTFRFELETEEILGKELHSILQGKELLPGLEGYELEITGMSDKAGFTAMKEVPGIGLKKILLTYGKAMHRRPKREGKKKRSNPTPGGLRLRKTVRGRVVSPDIIQINLKVVKEGAKKLSEIFEEQTKAKESKENRKAKRSKAKEPQEEQKPQQEIKVKTQNKTEKSELKEPEKGVKGEE